MTPETTSKLEDAAIVDQKPHRALALVAAHSDLFARQGSVVQSWRHVDGKRYGPYYRLTYREDGRQRAVYLGRAGSLVEEVRQRLAALQRPWRQHRAWTRMRRDLFRSMRQAKAQMDRQLRPLGLRMQGFEVRGWRTSPMRKHFAQARSEQAAALRAMEAATRVPRVQLPSLPRVPSFKHLTRNLLPRLPALP